MRAPVGYRLIELSPADKNNHDNLSLPHYVFKATKLIGMVGLGPCGTWHGWHIGSKTSFVEKVFEDEAIQAIVDKEG
jgi:hypothetical protein